jgi:hypothetical protein
MSSRSPLWPVFPPYEREKGAALKPLPVAYRPRNTSRTHLQLLVHQHLESMLLKARARSEHGFGYPRFIEHTFRRLDNCGIVSKGFSRVRCQSCGYERLLGFSCKTKVCILCCVVR